MIRRFGTSASPYLTAILALATVAGCAPAQDMSVAGTSIKLHWPESLPHTPSADKAFFPTAQTAFTIEIDRFHADLSWMVDAEPQTAKFLIPAYTFGLRDNVSAVERKHLLLPYGGEKSGSGVRPSFTLTIPGAPLVDNASLTISGFASGLDEPLFTGTVSGVTVSNSETKSYSIALRFTSAIDADEDGFVPDAVGGSDCDDSRGEIFLGATEACDGLDTACDGSADEIQRCAWPGAPDAANSPMQTVPAGAAYVGWRNAEETPQKRIVVDMFYVDRYEVSVGDFSGCPVTQCGLPTTDTVAGIADYIPTKVDHPVVNVTWTQADAYCRWKGKDLPTEFQWEVAGRGLYPSERVVPWADGVPSFVDFHGNVESFFTRGPLPVGDLAESASPFGVYNMLGNAAEWTSSFYVSSRYSSIDENLDTPPDEPTTGTEKVYKGGGWASRATESYLFRRASAATDTTDPQIGFRCVVNP